MSDEGVKDTILNFYYFYLAPMILLFLYFTLTRLSTKSLNAIVSIIVNIKNSKLNSRAGSRVPLKLDYRFLLGPSRIASNFLF